MIFKIPLQSSPHFNLLHLIPPEFQVATPSYDTIYDDEHNENGLLMTPTPPKLSLIFFKPPFHLFLVCEVCLHFTMSYSIGHYAIQPLHVIFLYKYRAQLYST